MNYEETYRNFDEEYKKLYAAAQTGMTQEALKLALEALERFEGNKKLWPEAITAIKEALAQTQEPVAWVSEDVCKGQYIDGRPRKIWWECEKGVGTAFYTTPPQRTWVGLTDEQLRTEFGKLYPNDIGILELAENNRDFAVEAIGARHHWVAFQAGARVAEAKLKEKNT